MTVESICSAICFSSLLRITAATHERSLSTAVSFSTMEATMRRLSAFTPLAFDPLALNQPEDIFLMMASCPLSMLARMAPGRTGFR